MDLDASCPTDLKFGVASGEGLGEDALPAAHLTLSGFADTQPQPNIWTLAAALGGRIGLNLKFTTITANYGSVKRILREPQADA
jgi:hypothetical protein